MKETIMKTQTKTPIETKLLLGIAVASAFAVIGSATAGFATVQQRNNSNTNPQSITCESVDIGDYDISEKNNTQHLSRLSSVTEEIKKELSLRDSGRNRVTNATLKELLMARKEYLLKTIRYNPNEALNYLLSSEEQNKLHTSCVETAANTSGKIIFQHSDTFDNGESFDQVFLETNTKRYALYVSTSTSEDIVPNMTAQINGYKLDDVILFDGSDLPSKEWQEASPPPSTSANGQENIAVLLVNFSNKNNHLTQSTVDEMVFENVSEFYQESSYGNLTFDGNVYEVTLSEPQGCNEQNIGQLAQTEVKKTNDLSEYDKIVVMAPFGKGFNQGCGWCGRSVLNGDTIYIDTSCTSIAKDWGTVAHELGHAYGLHHATRYTCDVTQTHDIQSSEEQCYSEYGDNWSTMGESTSHMQFNAPHKELLEWFDNTNIIQTVTESGEYTVKTIETQEAGTKALKVQNGTDSYLYFEFRNPEYVDGIGVLKGSLIHSTFADKAEKTIGFDFTENTLVSLQVGDNFTDPSTGSSFTIKSIDVDNSEATVEITPGKTDFTPPEVSLSSAQFDTELEQGQEVIIETQASDASGIDRVELYYWYSEYDMRSNDPTLAATVTGEPFTFELIADDFIQGSLFIFARAYDTEDNSNDSEIYNMYRPYFE